MIRQSDKFLNCLSNHSFEIENIYLNNVFKNFSFYFFINDCNNIDQLLFNINQSQIITIDEFSEDESGSNLSFFIICFENTLIIIKQSEFFLLLPVFYQNKNSIIYCHSNQIEKKVRNFLDVNEQKIHFIFSQISTDNIFFNAEINSFMNEFKVKITSYIMKQNILDFWCVIGKSIASFLIQKSFWNFKNFQKQNILIQNYKEFFKKENNLKEIKFQKNEFIHLINLSNGSTGQIYMVYHIPTGKLYVEKYYFSANNPKFEVEKSFYLSNKHPLITGFYGTVQNKQYSSLIIEYINGKTLNYMDEMNLNNSEKVKIILQIMIVLEYLHINRYIYRDLKPDNIIIDENKTVRLIDFDQIVENPRFINITFDAASSFVAPEIYEKGFYTNKADIYSLGKIIEIVFHDDLNVLNLFKDCISLEADQRPNISEVIDRFYGSFSIFLNFRCPISELKTIKTVQDIHTEKYLPYWFLISECQNSEAQFELGQMYKKGNIIPKDINQAFQYYTLSANSNNIKALSKLGSFYSKKKYTIYDIKKAIFYFELASNSNYPKAQSKLGFIYLFGPENVRNENKAIFYLTSAADQNDISAQNNLGFLYCFKVCDYDKGLHYLTLAANQNDYVAQCNLGYFFTEGIGGNKNISKGMHYYQQSAQNNNILAQFSLGKIYMEGKIISRDIKKAIYYLSLAANQNEANSQFCLGLIYDKGIDVERDINKAIAYYTLAAKNDNADAQANLGYLYIFSNQTNIEKGLFYLTLASKKNNKNSNYCLGILYSCGYYVQKDINKAIYYFQLSAKQNSSESQYYLGFIYSDRNNEQYDINKALKYLQLSSNQNNSDAQNLLGKIYYEGDHVKADINKSIYYYSLAVKQNNINSLEALGIIYSNRKYIEQDFKKAIYYLTLASNQNSIKAQIILGQLYCNEQNPYHDIYKAIHYLTLAAKTKHPVAQYTLGQIYYTGKYIPVDINKVIYYFTLASEQNNASAQTSLGILYSEGKYVPVDIKKAINYYELAASNFHPLALTNLGYIYHIGKHVPKDIGKAIHYYTLAANQSFASAQNNLGIIYFDENIDIKKAIYYLTLSANQSFTEAQKILGLIYYFGHARIKKDIQKTLHYWTQVAKKNDSDYNFFVGSIYFEGRLVPRDIDKAIYFFKGASSMNNQYAKNNLGMIYKNFKNDFAHANEYFKEAIRQKNDFLSLYNLGHMYFYDGTKDKEEDLIKYLIKASKSSYNINILLSLFIVKNVHPITLTNISSVFQKYDSELTIDFSRKIFQIIKEENLEDNNCYDNVYEKYKDREYVYQIFMKKVKYSDYISTKYEQYQDQDDEETSKLKKLTQAFYDGFGIDI